MHHIYIDGVRHNIVRRELCRAGMLLHVDHKDMPGVPCEVHAFSPETINHMQRGGAVKTTGHVYQTKEPR